MLRLRFLQLSDLHFGSPMSHSRLGLSPEKQAQRHQEFEQLVLSLPRLVQQHDIQVVFIPGDLWDQESMAPAQKERFLMLYGALVNMQVPVVISPGNHDYYSPRSFYHPDFLQSLGLSPWPEQVVIFSDTVFSRRPLPGWEGRVWVTGRAFHDNDEREIKPGEVFSGQARLLQSLPPREPSEALDLLLFHGARDDFAMPGKKMTAPFSRAELLALNYDYTAIGHYHTHEEFADAQGQVRGAYGGCPFARGLDEEGDKSVILGTLTKSGAALAAVQLERLRLDTRQIRKVHVPLGGHDSLEALEEWVFKYLSNVANPGDMVYALLEGRLPAGMQPDWEALEAQLAQGDYFSVRLDPQGVSTNYDLARLRQDPYTLEGRFIARMEEKLAQTQNEAEKTVLEQALYLGLDALTGMGVRTP